MRLSFSGFLVFAMLCLNTGIAGATNDGAGHEIFLDNVGIGTLSPRQRLEVNNTAVFSTLVANTCSGSATINWNAGNKQLLTLNGNCTTLNFTAPLGVGNFNLKIVNTGSYTITWPAVKWPGGNAPTLTASGTDMVSFFYDGTAYYASAAFDFK